MIEKLGAVAKLIPLFSIIAYGIGFITFVIYFIKAKALGKVNFFTYMQLGDHITMFGIGVFLSVVLVFALIPSLFIYEYVMKKGRTLIKKALSAIATYFVMTIFIADIGTFGSNMELFKTSFALFAMNLFVAYMGTFETPNKQPIGGLILPMLVFLVTASFFLRSPDSLIRMSGYGNQWACLSLSSSEGRFIQTNPNLKDIIKYNENGDGYTDKKVFIILKLRDNVFFSKGKGKADDIEVIPTSGIQIYNVSASEGSCSKL